MEIAMEHDPYDDMGPDPDRDLSDLEPVEVAPGYHAEICISFTGKQLAAISQIAQQREISPGQVVRDLVEQALTDRQR